MQLFHILLLFLSVKSMIVKNWSAVHFYHIVIRTIHVSNVFRNYINAAKFQVQTFCNANGQFRIVWAYRSVRSLAVPPNDRFATSWSVQITPAFKTVFRV